MPVNEFLKHRHPSDPISATATSSNQPHVVSGRQSIASITNKFQIKRTIPPGQSVPDVAGLAQHVAKQMPEVGARNVLQRLSGPNGRSGSPVPGQVRAMPPQIMGPPPVPAVQQSGIYGQQAKKDPFAASTLGSDRSDSEDTVMGVDGNMTRFEDEQNGAGDESEEEEEMHPGHGGFQQNGAQQQAMEGANRGQAYQQQYKPQQPWQDTQATYYNQNTQRNIPDDQEYDDGQGGHTDDEGNQEQHQEQMKRELSQGINGRFEQANYGQRVQQQQRNVAIPVRVDSPNNALKHTRFSAPQAPPILRAAQKVAPPQQYQQQHQRQPQYVQPQDIPIPGAEDEYEEYEDEDEADQALYDHAAQQRARQGKPIHQRYQERKTMFAPSDIAEEDTIHSDLAVEPQLPPPKANGNGHGHVRQKSGGIVERDQKSRKRAAGPELDYDKKTLFGMAYQELANQTFETRAPAQRASAVVIKGKTLQDKLGKAFLLSKNATPDDETSASDQQVEFLRDLSIREWEEAGDWFVGRFGDVMKNLVELRRERRNVADGFEKRLAERDAVVARKVQTLDEELRDMKKGGMGILRGKTPTF